MHSEIGLKLFSTNLESLAVVEKLYIQKILDYIELMIIPGSYSKTIEKWRNLNIPIVIHAPHSQYGFNLSDKKQRRSNAKLFVEVREFANSLSTDAIIVHPGLTGEVGETICQIKAFKDKRILVENMPFVSLLGTRCVGASFDEIKTLLEETSSGFCLDIVHAVKSAYSNDRESFSFLKSLMGLKPAMVHLCGLKAEGCFDEHLNLDEGDLDLNKLFRLMEKKLPPIRLTLETPEKNYKKLLNFRKNAKRVKKLIGIAGK